MSRYRDLFDLSGRTAVIVGGAGIIGEKMVAGFADHGARIALLDRNLSAARQIANQVAGEYGVEVLAYEVDIANPDSLESLSLQVSKDLGDPEILVSNAASKGEDIGAFFAPFESYSLSTWREIMAVNLDGMFNIARVFGSPMAKRGRGAVIQTASIYGHVAPDQRIYEGAEYLGRAINTPAVYATSKAGVIGLTRFLATYWAASGVRVNTLTPGGVESGQNGEFQSRYSARVPLARMARADEMVGAAIFLASDASSYVTGQNLIVDGGLSAW